MFQGDKRNFLTKEEKWNNQIKHVINLFTSSKNKQTKQLQRKEDK